LIKKIGGAEEDCLALGLYTCPWVMVYGPFRTAAGSIARSCLDVPGVFFCKRVEDIKT
jgi:hypothetical protein